METPELLAQAPLLLKVYFFIGLTFCLLSSIQALPERARLWLGWIGSVGVIVPVGWVITNLILIAVLNSYGFVKKSEVDLLVKELEQTRQELNNNKNSLIEAEDNLKNQKEAFMRLPMSEEEVNSLRRSVKDAERNLKYVSDIKNKCWDMLSSTQKDSFRERYSIFINAPRVNGLTVKNIDLGPHFKGQAVNAEDGTNVDIDNIHK